MKAKHNTNGSRLVRWIDWSKYDHMLGEVADSKIAKMIGCTSTGVRNRRDKLGIQSKFKTHLTIDEKQEIDELKERGEGRCIRCKEIKPLSEYDKSKKQNGTSGNARWCKECKAIYQSNRTQERRKRWLDLAGGCCQHCGFDRYSVSLDFHHIDGNDKDYTPGKLMMSRPIDSGDVYEELDKCAILCCNCHHAIHRRQLVLEFIKRDGLGWTVKK